MFDKLKILATTVLLAAGLLFPAGATSLQKVDFVEAQRSYEQTMSQRERIIDELQRLEARYRGLVRRIDELKRSGAMSTIPGRLELQDLLSSSKALADELDAVQRRVRALDNRLTSQRSTLLGGIDARIADLEASLARASTNRRKAIVSELNALRRRRGSYTTPLPAVPNPGEVDSAIRLAEEAAHPDELMAAADELQDTEDQLRRRLEAIEENLSSLKKSRALVRRARSFSREEKFFEETDRDRVIARYERESGSPRASEPKATTDGGAGGTATVEAGDDSPAPPDDGAVFEGNNAAEPGTGQFADEMAAASDADARTGGGTVHDAQLTDSPTGARVAEDSSDPFAGSRETIVIDGGGDPSRAVGRLGGGSGDLESQIERLEREQKKLEEQADELSRRARELRRRASDM